MLEIDIRYVAVSTEWIYTASISTFSSPLTPSWPNAASPAPGHGSDHRSLPCPPPSLVFVRSSPPNSSFPVRCGYYLRPLPSSFPYPSPPPFFLFSSLCLSSFFHFFFFSFFSFFFSFLSFLFFFFFFF